ncbi:hypothetical protein SLS58_007337 [Diplodia intermedia]|uniref:Uncharacterized protein n=1 Tax=Diplodia intermedia TaxID=856260 RepID=A0ABR3TKJ7_9PEZI
MSLVAPLAGLANLAKLPPGQHLSGADKSGQGDVVIRQAGKSGEGGGHSFDIVRCSRAVAEEVFFAHETASYTMKHDYQYYLITALADVLLRISVVFLALSTTMLQAYFIAGYAILTLVYGLTSTIPSTLYLLTSPYIVEEEKIDEPESPTYTQALWKAIVLTKSINWINLGDMAPRDAVWTEWLRQACEAAQIAASTESGGVITWEIPKEFNAQEKLNELLNAAHTASKQLTDQHDQNSEATNTRRFSITS